jgi:hypothetical protein
MSFYGFSKNLNFRSKSISVSLRFSRKSPVYDKIWPKLYISWSWPTYFILVILNGLLYEFLWVFKKFKFLLKMVLDYGFTENRQFAAKTDRNSVFLGPDTHISDRLYLMVLYMSFYRFSKISNFQSKSICVTLWFSWKSTFCDKNWPKLCISWSRPPYSRLVILNGPVYEFLRVFKKIIFSLKIHIS